MAPKNYLLFRCYTWAAKNKTADYAILQMELHTVYMKPPRKKKQCARKAAEAFWRVRLPRVEAEACRSFPRGSFLEPNEGWQKGVMLVAYSFQQS